MSVLENQTAASPANTANSLQPSKRARVKKKNENENEKSKTMFERPFLSVWHSWLIFIWTFFHFPSLATACFFFRLAFSHHFAFYSCIYYFFRSPKLCLNLQNRKPKKKRIKNIYKKIVHRWYAACTLMLMIDSMLFVDSKFALHKVHNAQYVVSGIRLKHYKITSWSNIVLFLLLVHFSIYHAE